MDITIQKGNSLPGIERCTDCCSLFHCPFCSPKSFLPTLKSKVKIHLRMHFNKAVQHAGYTIHRCGRICRPMQHFHCPFCQLTVLRKDDFVRHVKNCKGGDSSVIAVQASSTADDASEPNVSTADSEHGSEPDSENESFADSKEQTKTMQKKKCPKCPLSFSKANLEKHIQNKHAEKENESATPRKRPSSLPNDKENEEVLEQNVDITIQRGDSLPVIKKCTECCSYFHCPFCSPKSFLPSKESRLKVHLKLHLNRALRHAGYTIHRCGRTCRNQPHFHCPYCGATVLRREDFQRHLQSCTAQYKSGQNPSSGSSSGPNNAGSIGISPDQEQQCPKCHLMFRRRNLQKHIMLRHTAKEIEQKPSPRKRLAMDNGEEAQEQILDITIQKGDALPEIKQCTECCSDFHCPFCSAASFRPCKKSRVIRHLQIHFNRSVQYAGYTIHRCGRLCRGQPHYHCPFCTLTLLRKSDFLQHIWGCKSKTKSDPAVLDLIPADGAPEVNGTPIQRRSYKPSPMMRQKCPSCHLVFYKRNLKRHIERRHSLEISPSSSTMKSECVDQQNGVYAVHQIVRGHSRPVHVQIKMQGDEQYVSCEFSLCQAKMELAHKTGLTSYKCVHLQSVSNCRTFLSPPSLSERTLTECVKKRLFGKSKIKTCIDRQIQAMQQNTPLSVMSEIAVPPTKKYISVYEPNISHFSKLLRVMVSYNSEKSVWYCPCARNRKGCTHKYIAKWHLFQKDPGLFLKGAPRPKTGVPKAKRPKTKARHVQKPEAEFALVEEPPAEFQRPEAEVQSEGEDTAMEILETIATAMETNVTVVSYPPKEVPMIKNMVHYLLVNKKLPSVPPEHLVLPSTEKDYPQHLVPAETFCLFCADAIALSQPILITHKAKILTNTRAVQDVSSYYKFCPRCGVPYRYQEWGDGLHNFNDHLILDLPLCLSIRNMLQAHNGFDQIVEYLRSTIGAAFPSADTLLGAYLHFEALTDHQHQYSCVTWGDRPPVVVMELQNRTFNLSGRDLAGPAAALTGPGDMDHLWKALTEERIARGLVTTTKKSVLYKIL